MFYGVLMTTGIFIIAIGDKAQTVSKTLIASLNKFDILYHVHSKRLNNKLNDKQNSRIAKTSIFELSPFDYTLYLDADTIVLNYEFNKLFQPLYDGFDLCISHSDKQDFWHIGKDERESYISKNYHPLQYQCGVFSFRRNKRVSEFFDIWKDEYLEYCDEDQLSFVRAFHKIPLKTFITSPKVFNNGNVIKHNFGLTR